MKKIAFILLFLSIQAFSQFQKMDSLGSFYVIDYQLVWQKWYPLEDKVSLDRMLKSNDFTSDLDILKFTKSTKTKPYRLVGENLPEYAQHDYEAFLYLDMIGGRYRITIKQIVFPDFIEKEYYNGRRMHNPRGTLEQYILRQDGLIKRNNGTINVLNTFDTAFSQIFDPMGGESYE
ncbi:hypothetical protein [Lutimonas zeaxanthinifaciens]|uniref:hypothetical protein n=1 Tax=Lutimonas zeaxanthinifaciens TaxID=3060215 RepID=UPI00265C9A45|nr:hypothetical protein [Lutimonas sp. YSD2104]WKK67473.1 hypothetical protein QZH61_07555 [Lutimonas sp. YSD2104]